MVKFFWKDEWRTLGSFKVKFVPRVRAPILPTRNPEAHYVEVTDVVLGPYIVSQARHPLLEVSRVFQSHTFDARSDNGGKSRKTVILRFSA